MDRVRKSNYKMGDDGFCWFQGVVENIIDPKKLGRVRVRILGDHTHELNHIPQNMLPWAQIMSPIGTASMNGIGEAPIGMVPGTWVMGFYRDGMDKQSPVIIGTLPGIPEDPSDASVGFCDPNEIFPLKSFLNEPDTNRLARGVEGGYADNDKHDALIIRKKEVKKGMPTCTDEWDEPDVDAEPIYPYNKVKESVHDEQKNLSKWGHIEEIDDTPGKERTFRWHKTSHNSMEIKVDGTQIEKIYGDGFELNFASKHLRIDGDYKVTIKGNKTEKICGDFWQHIEGKCIQIVDGEKITVGKDKVVVHSDKDNITKSLTNIYEVSLEDNIRHSGTKIYDAAVNEISAIANDMSIAHGIVNAPNVVEVPPSGGYSYSPFTEVIQSAIEKNTGEGSHTGDLYNNIPTWDNSVVGTVVNHIKLAKDNNVYVECVSSINATANNDIKLNGTTCVSINASAIYNDASEIHNYGDTFLTGPIGIDPREYHEYIIPYPANHGPDAEKSPHINISEISEHSSLVFVPQPIQITPWITEKIWKDS